MITSKQNQFFKLYKSLLLKKYRDQQGLFLVYGKHLIDAAKNHGVLKEVITSNPEIPGMLFEHSLFLEFQQTETYIDQIGVCEKLNREKKSNRMLILEDIQDPDNLGALIRSAAAFGFLHVLLSPKCADIYNEKTIRASKGAIFDVYTERKPLIETVKDLKDEGFSIVCTSPNHSTNHPIGNQIAVILGNEGQGVSEALFMLSDTIVTIETKHVESLNVSVAGGIIMHQWRQL
jgi:TrmH family RNA methyltransferase